MVQDTWKGKRWDSSNTEPTDWDLTNTSSGFDKTGELVFMASAAGMYVGAWALMAAVANAPTITIDSEEAFPEITAISIVDADAGVVHSKRKYYNFQVKITDWNGNTIPGVVSVDKDFVFYNFGSEDVIKPLRNIDNTVVDEDPGFVNFADENFQLKDSSPAYELGFERIPVEKIGLYKDEYRKCLKE